MLITVVANADLIVSIDTIACSRCDHYAGISLADRYGKSCITRCAVVTIACVGVGYNVGSCRLDIALEVFDGIANVRNIFNCITCSCSCAILKSYCSCGNSIGSCRIVLAEIGRVSIIAVLSKAFDSDRRGRLCDVVLEAENFTGSAYPLDVIAVRRLKRDSYYVAVLVCRYVAVACDIVVSSIDKIGYNSTVAGNSVIIECLVHCPYRLGYKLSRYYYGYRNVFYISIVSAIIGNESSQPFLVTNGSYFVSAIVPFEVTTLNNGKLYIRKFVVVGCINRNSSGEALRSYVYGYFCGSRGVVCIGKRYSYCVSSCIDNIAVYKLIDIAACNLILKICSCICATCILVSCTDKRFKAFISKSISFVYIISDNACGCGFHCYSYGN